MHSLGIAQSEETSAGYWGDYNCDIPTWAYRKVINRFVQCQERHY